MICLYENKSIPKCELCMSYSNFNNYNKISMINFIFNSSNNYIDM